MDKEKLKKENAKLQEKISVLLSCKNCPENKGGWICVKEYENKCLAQKIEFIKELEEENSKLKGIKDIATLIRANNNTVITLMQLNNMLVSKNQQLTKAKELLTKWVELFKPKGGNIPPTPIQVETEQFIREVEK